ncbi:MAG TPA: sugar kinase [Bryobacteraceae bacterium]|nr:sugar kinase [Bryobacteraceae bacterium]
MKILIAGELNLDLILQNYRSFPALGREVLVEDVTLTMGSASAICACGLARLGNDVTFTSTVGADSWGEHARNILAGFGIDISRVVTNSKLKTGITVSISSPTDRALVTYSGASTALTAGDFTRQSFRGFRHLHVSSFFIQEGLRPGMKKLFDLATDCGLTTSLDPGFDPLETWGSDLRDALSGVDVFLPNEVELERVTGLGNREEALRSLANGRTLTIAKLGVDGCMTLRDGKFIAVPGFQVKPVDTTGAGDSFNAGFLHAWLRGSELREAMTFAAACGALSTLASGGTGAQPTEKQARDFLTEREAQPTGERK